MVWLYDLGILFFRFGIRIAAWFNPKAKKRIHAEPFFQTYPKHLAPNPIWFHSASVGEFEQALPLYEKLKSHHPELSFVFTFFSPSGYEYAQKKYPKLVIGYLPFDSASDMKVLVETIKPRAVIVVKYEFWYHFLHQLKEKNIPCFLVSGVFRNGQPFFRHPTASFFKPMLFNFRHLFVQDQSSAELLKTIGVQNTTVTGDTRLDRVRDLAEIPFHDHRIEEFLHGRKAIVAGSVWQHDTPVLIDLLQTLPENTTLLVVPHEPEHFAMNWTSEAYSRYSVPKGTPSRILLIDQMGLLSKVYRYGYMAYVGGGFGKGIHNILEPAVYGQPVLFGPNHNKFLEAYQLKQLEVGFSVQPGPGFRNWVRAHTSNPDFFVNTRRQLTEFFEENANISEKIYVYLRNELRL
jgi:3-deoxy-D-manno-octulosonic-acid transferase